MDEIGWGWSENGIGRPALVLVIGNGIGTGGVAQWSTGGFHPTNRPGGFNRLGFGKDGSVVVGHEIGMVLGPMIAMGDKVIN